MSRLYYTRCPVPTATTLAARTGLLDPGLSSLQDAANRHLLDHHFDHGLPGLIREGGNIPALWTAARRAPTRLVAITWVDEYQAVLALPGSGITGPADLEGRTVAIPRSSGRQVDIEEAMALRGFELALRLAGLGLDDVRRARLADRARDVTVTGLGAEDYGPAAQALRDGDADAIWVKGAAGIAARRSLGAVEVVDLGAHPDPLTRVNNGTPRTITVHAELLETSPETVDAYLAALLRAARWARGGGPEVTRVLAEETGRSADEAGHAYGRGPRTDFAPGLDEEMRAALADQSRFLSEHGFAEAPVDLGTWIDPGPLHRASALLEEPT